MNKLRALEVHFCLLSSTFKDEKAKGLLMRTQEEWWGSSLHGYLSSIISFGKIVKITSCELYLQHTIHTKLALN